LLSFDGPVPHGAVNDEQDVDQDPVDALVAGTV
jgi:hypothetical protein